MLLLALKMLIADRAKFIGLLIGITFSTFIITQQSGILVGVLSRTFGFITDTSQGDIWVVDPRILYIEDIKKMKYSSLFLVRGVEGVEWAVPLFKGIVDSQFPTGKAESLILVGIDDNTLIGGPPIMLQGNIADLREADAVIINDVGAEGRLSSKSKDGTTIPAKIGDVFEMNDKRAKVVGICQVQRTFRSEPVVYTTFKRSLWYSPAVRERLSYIIVKAKEGVDPEELVERIKRVTKLGAYTNDQFKELTVRYYLKNTGILINFGFAVILGFIIGVVITGQTFYNFALDNLRYFAILKAMGAKSRLLTKMLGVQALFVGVIGYGFGIGLTTLFSIATRHTELSFKFPLILYLSSLCSILLIITFSAYLSLRKILRVDPIEVFNK